MGGNSEEEIITSAQPVEISLTNLLSEVITALVATSTQPLPSGITTAKASAELAFFSEKL